jgi:hypothetical protein
MGCHPDRSEGPLTNSQHHTSYAECPINQSEILRRLRDSGRLAIYFFASFAHASLKVLVRFHTCFSRVESGSRTK